MGRGKAAKTPEEVLADAIASHPTFSEAADALGVSAFTLRRWRKRWPVEVA